MPASWSSLSTCSWLTMPLSLTSSVPLGTPPARLIEVSSVVSKVRRLRLLMPMNSAPSPSARSSSSWSCTSTSASIFHSSAASSR
ncbi:hypothetical protein D9M68_985830 [compost metagenome]